MFKNKLKIANYRNIAISSNIASNKRYYPVWAAPKSKFSDNTTERELREYEENNQAKIEDFKNRDESTHDKIIAKFDLCESKKEAKEILEEMEKEIKKDSSKFIEELKDDASEMKAKLENSNGYSKESISKLTLDLDKHLEENIICEGEHIGKLLEQLHTEYEEACDFFYNDSDFENQSECDDGSEVVSQSNEKKDCETKQSPIDYIIEKQNCEMPDIPDSDGGD